MLIRLPGVYRPQADTSLLSSALTESGIPGAVYALDAFTGTGALAVAAAQWGAEHVIAVDVSAAAVATAGLNLRLHGVHAELRHGDFLAVLGTRRFDLVLANPPYVPSAGPVRGRARAWNGGPDGRAVLNRLCTAAPCLLNPGGTALIVQSALADPEQTLVALRCSGLKAAIVARTTVAFGPVLRTHADWLRSTGRISPGDDTEELVVIRSDRTRI